MKVYTPTGLRDKIKLWALRAIFKCDGVYDLVIRSDDSCNLFHADVFVLFSVTKIIYINVRCFAQRPKYVAAAKKNRETV